MNATAKEAGKAFAAARRKHFGNSVKSLVQRALERTKESYKICSKPSADESEGSKAVAQFAVVLEGRLGALECVLEALNGNKAMLRHWGSQ